MPLRPHAAAPLRALAAAILALGLLGTLTACDPGIPAVSPGPSPGDSASPDPAAEPSETPTEPAEDPAALLRTSVRDAVSSGETEALQELFTDPVRVVIASSEADSRISPLDAVLALDYVRPGVGTWEWELPAATIDGYRASAYYSDYFPEDVIVGRSSEGPVVAFSTDGEHIHTVLMAIDEDLLFY